LTSANTAVTSPTGTATSTPTFTPARAATNTPTLAPTDAPTDTPEDAATSTRTPFSEVKPTERPPQLPPTGEGSARAGSDGSFTWLVGLFALSSGLAGLGYWRLRLSR
jgi:hypothetical protein